MTTGEQAVQGADAGTVTPVASVVIPVLNGQVTLAEQLEALAGQTFTEPFEVIVCDNGSVDGTVGLLKEWQRRMPQLRWVNASSRPGPGHARNQGIVAARGEVVAFCDADDVVADDWLQVMVTQVRPATLVCGWNENGLLQGEPEQLSTELGVRDNYLVGVWSGNFAMTRADAISIGGFDERFRYVEDLDFGWRAQRAGSEVVSAPAIVHVRQRPSLRGVFRQRRNWGRFHIRLRTVHAAHARLDMSIKYSVLTLLSSAVLLPVRWPSATPARRTRLVEQLGALVGEVEGHLRYRVLGRVPATQLLDGSLASQ